MRRRRKSVTVPLTLILLVAVGVVLFLLFVRPALALNFYFTDTTLLDFNQGSFYHSALSLRDDGEIQLLPIGLGQPWVPGNTTGLVPIARMGIAQVNGHIYVIGGDTGSTLGSNAVYFTTVYTNVLTPTARLDDWQTTTPLPTDILFYPEGLYRCDAAALHFTETNKTFLYVIGGAEDNGGMSTYYDKVAFAEVLADGQLGPWQLTTAPLPHTLVDMESAVLYNRLYVVGGMFGGVSQKTVYVAEPDPTTGQITVWSTTTPLPTLAVGGYRESAVTVEHGRIYVYGGGSGVSGATYSYFVFFGEVDPDTGMIPSWSVNTEFLPQNCYASEGAAYQSGLLLAVAGAWACGEGGCSPTGDVRAALVDHGSGQTFEWVSTIGMDPPRYYHGVVQDEMGWLYSIGGWAPGTPPPTEPLLRVDIAPAYAGGGGRFAQSAPDNTVTYYAPYGTFRSSYWDVRPVRWPGYHATLTGLSWNTTITNPATMAISMTYRYYSPELGDWTPWSEPIGSPAGISETSAITFPLTATCDLFQYAVTLTGNFNHMELATQTPQLNWVRVSVLAPPDLEAMTLTVTGCDTCPGFVPLGEPVQITLAVRNNGSNLPQGNGFYAMIFPAGRSDYVPVVPDLPAGCDVYSPTQRCPLIIGLQPNSFPEGAPPLVLTTTYTFTTAGIYHLVGYVDYNDTPSKPAPIYDVYELNEFNNRTSEPPVLAVGLKYIYLPLITKGWP